VISCTDESTFKPVYKIFTLMSLLSYVNRIACDESLYMPKCTVEQQILPLNLFDFIFVLAKTGKIGSSKSMFYGKISEKIEVSLFRKICFLRKLYIFFCCFFHKFHLLSHFMVRKITGQNIFESVLGFFLSEEN